MRHLLIASFISLPLLACGGDEKSDSTDTSITGTDTGTDTGKTTGTETGVATDEPTTSSTGTTPATATATDDTGVATDDTGVATDDTGVATDDTGVDDTGPDDTGPMDTGSDSDTDTDTGTDTGPDPMDLSFAADVYGQVIMPSCGCHTQGAGGLIFGGDADSAYAAIVGVASKDVPDMSLVEPFDSDFSYLYHKVNGTHIDVGGEGEQMPKGGMLNPDQVALIASWIDGGALL